MKHILLTALFMMVAFMTFSQGRQQNNQLRTQQQVVVKGSILEASEKLPLQGAHLSFRHVRDTSMVYQTTSATDGSFNLTLPRGMYQLRVTYIGYRPHEQQLRATEEINETGQILLIASDSQLDEVTVTGEAVPVRQKGDTLQFSAQAFKTNPDASAEDLVRKLPGVTIDTEGVKAQGESVQRVLVDGQEFFGNDPNIALRNLPAEMIDQVEIFDQQSEQSRLTGFDDGERIKTINIVTRLDRRSGQFGRAYAGYGDDDRYQAGLTTNFFMDQRRISIIGMSNNINQQNFSSEDLSGFNQSRGGRGGGMGGMRGSGGGAPSGGGGMSFNRGDFLIGQQSGNNTTHSYGINYTDIWNEKVNVNSSYFFNLSRNVTEQLTDRQYFIDEDQSQFYSESNTSDRDNHNHRFNARIDYKINEKHNLLVIPRFSFQKTSTNAYSEASSSIIADQLLNQTMTAYDRRWDGYSFSNALIYRARISEKGRSISARLNLSLNNNEYLYFLDALSSYYNGPIFTEDLIDQQSTSNTNSYGLSSNLSYTEPLGEKSMLQFSYNLSFSDNSSDRMTNSWDIIRESYSLFENDLSSDLTNGYLTNRFGVGYRFRNDKYNLLAEVSYQHARLTSEQAIPYQADIDYTFKNIIPMLQFNYTFSRSQTLRLMYRSFTNAPSVSQLQDMVDNSNPLLLSSGNPDLEQSYSHFFTARYNLTNVASSRSLFAFVFGNLTNNYIGNSTIIARQDTILSNGYELPRGAQFTRPQNLSGHINLRSSLTYGFPVSMIKSNVSLSAGLAYSRLPGEINGKLNFANNYNTNGGLSISSNISPNIDFTISYRLNYQIVKNSVRPQLDNNYFYHISEMRFNWIFMKGWVFRNDISNLYYTGLGDDFNEHFWLWNVNIGKKIFNNQRGEITIGVYDLLNQNKSVSRNATDTYVEDLRYNVLNRFYMLTFTYNFRNFGVRS